MEKKNEDMENPVASTHGHDAPQKFLSNQSRFQ